MIIFISGITSEIGSFLCRRFIGRGDVVYGTYRSAPTVELKTLVEQGKGTLFKCDYCNNDDIESVIKQIQSYRIKWDVFVSSVGVLTPISRFADCNIDEFENTIHINALSQLLIIPARGNRASGRTETVCPERGNHRYASLLA